MSESASKSRLNRDAVADNETIFDFLKRKKQFNLENTVNKSLIQHSHTKRKADIDYDDDFPQMKDLTKYHTHDSKKVARTTRQTITPRKLDFDEPQPANKSVKSRETNYIGSQQQNNQQSRPAKSFLAMISPLKNRPASALEERKDDQDNRSYNK